MDMNELSDLFPEISECYQVVGEYEIWLASTCFGHVTVRILLDRTGIFSPEVRLFGKDGAVMKVRYPSLHGHTSKEEALLDAVESILRLDSVPPNP